MNLTKETLRKMSLLELEGKLSEVKAKFAEASTRLSAERQAQILKAKALRGKAAKRKQELISQILNIQKQIQKTEAQFQKITVGENAAFEMKKTKAILKEKQRKRELKTIGTYQTPMTDEEKVLAWCHDMNVDRETLNKLLEKFSIEELANMSGDDFYDEVQDVAVITIFDNENEEELTFESILI